VARLIERAVEAKAICLQRLAKALRSSVYKCVESLEYDPNPSDLGGGRLKRLERGVEDRKRF
jgi:hypothetical protein